MMNIYTIIVLSYNKQSFYVPKFLKIDFKQ